MGGDFMKQLLLFQPGVETLKFFSERLAEEYTAMGYHVRLVRIHESFSSVKELCEYLSQGETVMITFNFHAIQREAIFYTEEKELLWDLYSVFCINIIVDHPFYYYDELKSLPKRYLQICIDQDHTDYMKRFYPQIALGETLPLAGCRFREDFPFADKDNLPDISSVPGFCFQSEAEKTDILPQESRSTSVVFTGCFTNPDFFLPYMKRNGKEYEVFYQGILDDLLANPDRCIHEVYLQHLNRELPDLGSEDLTNVMNKMIFLDLWTRFTFRGRVIRSLVDAQIPVRCIGAGWETLSCKNPSLLTQSGYSDTQICLKEIAGAKISLNVMPWFKKGAHDRIYSSMLNGAVCVTDPSSYLLEHFTNDDTLVYYRLNQIDSLPQIVLDLLSSETKRIKIAGSAYRLAAGRLTWTDYAKKLIPYFS